jgi:AcrR family transcriptional regulator
MAGTAPNAATRERILAAAIEVITEEGIGASNVAIAERAGLTRMTLYRHFGSHDELLVALLLHESARLVPGLQVRLENRRRRFPRRVADAITFLVDEIPANPVLGAFVDHTPPTTVPAIDPQFAFVSEVRAFFRPYFVDPANRAQLRFDPERTLDYTLRQLLLYLTTPGEGWTGPADLRADLDDFFIPAIARPRR